MIKRLIRITSALILLQFFTSIPKALATSKDTTLRKENSYLLRGFYERGSVFQTNDFVRGINLEHRPITDFQSFSLQFSIQTRGEKEWQQLFAYPDWGFGVAVADFHNPEEMGLPIAAYAFVNAPFKRWGKLSLNYDIALGLTFNWKRFNPITNQYNIAIGAGETVYINAGIGFEYLFLSRYRIGFGVSLEHYSNGALKKPNYGINTIAPRVSVAYSLENKNQPFIQQEITPNEKRVTLLTTVYTGLKNVLFDTLNLSLKKRYNGVYFGVFGLQTLFTYQISHKSRIGAGISISYDGSVNARIAIDNGEIEPVDLPVNEQIRLSIYPSYELVMNRFSLLIQPGIYIYRKQFSHQVPTFYQRIGLNYQIGKHLVTGVNLRAYNFYISDFIEWHIGYKMNLKK